jgi:hypothetical protein
MVRTPMQIVFLTGNLEPGRDGVGDYTRNLASACMTLGVSCALLALNDRHVNRHLEESQSCNGQALACLRLPATDSWSSRLRAAGRWLDAKACEWISLQFVPYGYHRKGLIGDLGRRLAPLTQGRATHIMLHELWIGMERAAPLRQRVLGSMQRQAVLKMLRQLTPAIAHTSNPAYGQLVATHGVSTKLLPLFGNVPIQPCPEVDWLGGELRRHGVPAARTSDRNRQWRFGLFGTIHPVWSPEPLFTLLEQAATQARRDVIIASIGRRGSGAQSWQALQHRYGHRFLFATLDERSISEISWFLQGIDVGIATTPWQLIGKSGTAATMLEHGLPVIVSRDDVDYGLGALEPDSPLLRRMDAELPQWLPLLRRAPPRHRLMEVAAQFIADLRSSANASTAAEAPTTPHRASTAA